MFSIGHLVYSHYNSAPSLISRERVFSKGRAISIALDIVTGVALGVILGLGFPGILPAVGVVSIAQLSVGGGYLVLTLFVNLLPIVLNSCHSQTKEQARRTDRVSERSESRGSRAAGSGLSIRSHHVDSDEDDDSDAGGTMVIDKDHSLDNNFDLFEKTQGDDRSKTACSQRYVKRIREVDLQRTEYPVKSPTKHFSVVLPEEHRVFTGPAPLKLKEAEKREVLSEPYQMIVERVVGWEASIDEEGRPYGGICESFHKIILPDQTRSETITNGILYRGLPVSNKSTWRKNVQTIKIYVYHHHFGIYTTDNTRKLPFFTLFKTDVKDPAIELIKGRIKINYDDIFKTLRLVVNNPDFDLQNQGTSEKDKKINVQWVSPRSIARSKC